MIKMRNFGIIALFLTLKIIYAMPKPFTNCDNMNGKNFTLINGPWEVQNENKDKVYYFNLCGGEIPNCTSGTAVCMKKDDQFITLGTSSNNPVTSETAEGTSFYLNYNTTKSCGDQNYYGSSILFECGKTLGSPEIVYSDDCRVDILWETFLACRSTKITPTNAVKCYVYDSDNNKHDLNALIKQVGGYKVFNPDYPDSNPRAGLFINVCQSLESEVGLAEHGVVGGCPKGSGACLVDNDGNAFEMGALHDPLVMKEDKRLQIVYHGRLTAENHVCMNNVPNVTITFVCPGKNRGRSKPPLLTSSALCQYEVEWWTEAACTVDFISVKNSCKLDLQKHAINLDLTPLSKSTGQYVYDSQNMYGDKYLINICGNTHSECGTDTTCPATGEKDYENAVCQISNSCQAGRNSGKLKDYILQYNDGALSLTYKNGTICRHNNQKRSTIINFQCNTTAGFGAPEFDREIHCIYYFNWQTSAACVGAHPKCQFTNAKGYSYDISSLTRFSDSSSENWEVLTGVENNKDRYFINVCSEVLRTPQSSSNCPVGSAVCLIQSSGGAKSLGSFMHSQFTQDGGRLKLIYSEGDTCADSKKIQSTINLYCKPGDIERSPAYKFKSSDGCHYEFDWHTAAACKVGVINGSNCAVSDEDSGFTFDLSRLTSESSYKVTTAEYDYYLNVCGQLGNTPCNEGDSTNPAACQVSKDGTHFLMGQINDKPMYYNGFVKLVYKHGAKYHSGAERMTQISFLCDPSAGKGMPQFTEESHNTYVFTWYTSYVCPAAPVQCMVTDATTGDQYDLSSLAKSEDDADANWSVMEEDLTKPIGTSGKKVKYYINVCRPVNEVFGHNAVGAIDHKEGCDILAGACQTVFGDDGSEHVNISSLGLPTEGPTIESKGHLLLEYKGGSNCRDGNEVKQYSILIHFVCREGQISTTPRFLETKSCVKSFIWYTESACPITSSQSKPSLASCEVMDKNSEFVINLTPLKQKPEKPYKVAGPDGVEYELNICAKVNECGGANDNFGGCRNKAGAFDNKVLNSTNLKYSDDGVLTLQYQSNERVNNDLLSYIISFVCDRNAHHGSPTFSHIDGSHTYFDFLTPLACQPEPVDCLVTDDFGNQYDLSPLTRTGTAMPWTAFSGTSKTFYYINVCRPITGAEHCPVGSLGACKVDLEGDNDQPKGYNLGLVQSNPVALSVQGSTDSSTVSITYSNGDVCPANTQRRLSTRIIFSCSEERDLPPVFQDSHMDPCQYLFTWPTPAACKLKDSTGSNCKIIEPLYQMTFDLSKLKNQNDVVVNGEGEWNFKLAVCRDLKGLTTEEAACKNSGSCQVKKVGSDIHNAGESSANLTYQDGVISLTYLHGESCHQNKYERSSIIRFTCDHGLDENDIGKPSYIRENDDCTYIFDWPTRAACPPISVVECSASSLTGKQYDLSSLSQIHDNIQASTRGNVGSRSYYLNVCRSLLHKQGQTCPENSAVCVKKDQKFISLGKVSNGPVLNTEGELTLTYDDGDICDETKHLSYHTTITFRCDKNANEVTVPVVTSTEEDCHLEMLWVTRSACALGETEVTSGDCSVVNPNTGHKFNLSVLQQETYYTVHDTTGKTRDFHINVCMPVKDDKCPSDTGTCMVAGSTTINAGHVSKELSFKDGALILEYKNGDTCQADSRYKHTTVFSFVCHRSVDPFIRTPTTTSLPVYVGEDVDTCTHYFSWHTMEACEVHTPCAVVDSTSLTPRIIDLSSLISESGHITVISDIPGNDATYFINICRPLEPIASVFCPPGASVCEINNGKKPSAIGYMAHSVMPMFDSTSKTITITYPSSEKCTTAVSENVNKTSKIVFSCVPGGGKGNPRLIKVTDDCVYLFEWGTGVFCDDNNALLPSTTKTPILNDCSYFDKDSGATFDLSKIKPLKVDISGGASYSISICNKLTEPTACQGEAACRTVGGKSTVIGKMETKQSTAGAVSTVALQTTFTADKIDGETPTVTIYFMCARTLDTENENFNDHQIIENSGYKYTVYWSTPHVCPPLEKRCVVADVQRGLEYDLSLLSSISHYHTATDNDGNSYLINICKPVPQHNPVYEGCDENAVVCRKLKGKNKYQTLGVVESQTFSVKDKNSFEVRYSGGDFDFCSNTKSAATIIHFTCAKTIHTKPQFMKFEEDKCVFHFTWSTRIACPDETDSVTLTNDNRVTDPKTGITIDLSDIVTKHNWIANEIRNEKQGPSTYSYVISLQGSPDLSDIKQDAHKCTNNCAVCQSKKSNPNSERMIGEVSMAKYTMTDESLEVFIDSSDHCGKDDKKKSHVVITFRCSQYSGVGVPQFIYESNECGYFFNWYTNKLCVNIGTDVNSVLPNSSNGQISAVDHTKAGGSHAGAIVIAIFSIVILLAVIVLAYRRRNRGGSIMSACKVGYWNCCKKFPNSEYRYMTVGEEGGESLLEETREDASLLSHISSHTATTTNRVNADIDMNAVTDDPFGIPTVAVAGAKTNSNKNKQNPSKTNSSSSKTKSSRKQESDAEDLLGIGSNKNSKKVKSYHDEDDDDLLEF